MALTSFVQTNFAGGEISQTAQGRMDLPSYKISMNVCLNAIPLDTGAWVRRPGTRHVAPSRGGARGRMIPFSFAQSFPYNMEFTDGYLRFMTGPALVMTNDAQAVVAISAANPAVVQTTTAHGWSTGNTGAFNSLGVNNPLLQNRQFVFTVVDPAHVSIADAITGAAIDGATLGAFVSGNITRVMEIATPYTGGLWSTLRSVQAEKRSVLLNGSKPYILQVVTPPSTSQSATFSLGAADFIDGPYLDPIDGSYVTSSALNGVLTLTFSFQAYVVAKAYSIGDFVTDGGIGYRSLTAANQGNTPASHPVNWVAVNGGAAVNDGLGFVASDIGRLIRLFSEPQEFAAGTPYTVQSFVKFDGAYWQLIRALPGTVYPGTDATYWALVAGDQVAVWTWAQILSVSGTGLVAPVSAIGTISSGGGLAAAFDGNTTKPFLSGANFTTGILTYPNWSAGNWAAGSFCQAAGIGYQALMLVTTSSALPVWSSSDIPIGTQRQYGAGIYQSIAADSGIHAPPNATYWTQIGAITSSTPAGLTSVWQVVGTMPSPNEDVYIGQHYSSATSIQSVTLYPTTDVGFGNSPDGGQTLFFYLRGKATAPSSPSDGTLLGSALSANTLSPITITSSDQATAWNYVWVEITSRYSQPLADDGSHSFTAKIGVSQVQFYSPNVSNGSVVSAQIRGPALLYAQTIRTWRAGVYSDTTGWPTCGAYHEGRIWFGGVVENRFDGGVSNGMNGVQLDFAPTSPSGTVAGNNAISYTCTGEDSNQILWMTPDQQGILFGTKAGEWLISAPTPGPLAPTNVKAVRVTKIGCAGIEPKRTEHTLVFVQKFGRKIMEYFADVFSGKFTAPNLSERAKHLTVTGIAEIAYQQELAPTIWSRRTDGKLVGATYKRDTLTTSQGPTIIGWHRHQLGSGRLVESICVGPSVGGNLDTLSMITNDNASAIRHVEIMTDLLDEGFSLTDCWFLDDAIVPSSTVVQPDTGGPYGSLLVNGLWAHNGKTVTAFIAGLDCGDYVVSAGSITVPFGDGISGGSGNGLFTRALVQSLATLPAVVGFTYNSDGQLVRPVTQADTGAQAGPGWAKLGRQHRVAAQLYGAVNGSISFGTDFTTLDAAKLRYANDVPYPVNVQWSGIWRDQVNSIIDFDGMISWRISRPYPAFIVATGGFQSKADA